MHGETNKKLIFISFEKYKNEIKAFVDFDGFFKMVSDPELILNDALNIYIENIRKMKYKISIIENYRKNRILIPALQIWELGDTIFKLVEDLKNLGLQLNGLYNHLTRDLGVKKKWLEKVIIFRRHIPNKEIIPEDLNWGKCEKGTRRVAEEIRKNYYK